MLTHEYFTVTVLPAAGVALDANFHVVTPRFLLGWLIFLPEDLKSAEKPFLNSHVILRSTFV